jgi:glycosyltransferase involved in cell wall biosynthesis
MKLSIITINLNNVEGLCKTINSVINQTFHDYEYIVIDGGSTDGSVEIIKEHSDKIDYWISEQDKGIYNAMNKGVTVAHGDYCSFLNSGDAYADICVLNDVFDQNISADIVCGNVLTDENKLLKSPDKVTLNTFILGSIPHPSSFIKRTLLLNHLYDESEPVKGDWVFFMKELMVDNVSYLHINKTIVRFNSDGVSSRLESDNEISAIDSLKRYFPERIMEDYKIFRGSRDDYHRLFFILSHSQYHRLVYILIVILLKMITLNRGWIRSFPIFRYRDCK